MPTVRTFVLIISSWVSLRSPELVSVNSLNGINTSAHSCGASSDAGVGSQSRCWNRSDRTARVAGGIIQHVKRIVGGSVVGTRD